MGGGGGLSLLLLSLIGYLHLTSSSVLCVLVPASLIATQEKFPYCCQVRCFMFRYAKVVKIFEEGPIILSVML